MPNSQKCETVQFSGRNQPDTVVGADRILAHHPLGRPQQGVDAYGTISVPDYLKFLENAFLETMRMRGTDCTQFRIHLNDHGQPDSVYFTRPMDSLELVEIEAWRQKTEEERRKTRGGGLGPPQGTARYRSPAADNQSV